MSREEQETVLAYTAADDTIFIYSSIQRDITAMKKKDQFTLLKEGKHTDGTTFAEFSIARDRFDVARAAKTTRKLSPEQRTKLSERMTKLHTKNEED